MRHRPRLRRRLRNVRPRRFASWLVAFALLLQGAAGAGAALGMLLGAGGSDRMAASHCAAHPPAGKQGRGADHSSADHEHCLLCNVAAADRPAPALPVLSAGTGESIAPIAEPAAPAYRKVVYANAPRGPPRAA